MEVNMTEFKWKNNFIGQKIEIQHINKFEILLLMLKTKCKNTEKLEESTYSLEVQEFSIYEDFLVKHVLPKSEEIKEQSKLLHNQPLFNELITQIKPNVPLKISLKNKRKNQTDPGWKKAAAGPDEAQSTAESEGSAHRSGYHPLPADVARRRLPGDGSLLYQNHPIPGYQLPAGAEWR